MAEILRSSGITVEENNRPKIKCPMCRQIVVMDIKLFIQDVSKVIESNCPKCGAKIFTALLILINSDLKGLYGNIQTCIDALNPKTLHLT